MPPDQLVALDRHRSGSVQVGIHHALVEEGVKSYRPISNLSVISKLLERTVAKQLIRYLKDNDHLSDLQSEYRSGHSTETAVLKVLADIVQALDAGDFALLLF